MPLISSKSDGHALEMLIIHAAYRISRLRPGSFSLNNLWSYQVEVRCNKSAVSTSFPIGYVR